MVNVREKCKIWWSAPSPLWGERSAWIQLPQWDISPQPIILRFANDTFMEELLAILTHTPWRLSNWVAQPETWREPMPSPKPILITQTEPAIENLYNRIPQLYRPSNGRNPADRVDRTPAPLPPTVDEPAIKLFQAAHHRYYVVAASLVTEDSGHPDYSLNLGENERATFVVRALAPTLNGSDAGFDTNEEFDEYAFISTPMGMAWKKVALYKSSGSHKLIPGEDQLPLFPVAYQNNCGCHRQIHTGLIPVGKREEWMAAPRHDGNEEFAIAYPIPSVDGGVGHLKEIFQADVTEPWKALIDQAQDMKRQIDTKSDLFPNFIDMWDQEKSDENKEQTLSAARDQIQTGSWYVLLDFAKFIEKYLPDIWAAMTTASPGTLTPVERNLYDLLEDTNPPHDLVDTLVDENSSYEETDIELSLLDALVAVETCERDLEEVDLPFDRSAPAEQWPNFLFPLADPDPTIDSIHNSVIVPSVFTPREPDVVESFHDQLDALADLVDSLLPPSAVDPDRDIQLSKLPLFKQGGARFVIRYVFERPNCGFLFPAIVSDPTRQIEMAPFFDPDAPARSIRISLPADISPAGLRKYKKSAMLLVSDMLCGKLKGIKKLTLADLVLSVLPWPFHKDLPEVGPTGPCRSDGDTLGMFCSLSIPIVTLCALILMIIMVSLFDTFFRWIPYLFTCLPIPGFKGKKQ